MTPRVRHNSRTGFRRQCAAGPVRAAFTLMEIIVVVIILSILATAIVPKMLNVGQRQADMEARSVQRLLSIAAEKASVWNQPVAVDYQGERGMLTIWTQREDAKASADATGAARVRWSSDYLVEPVVLDRLKISTATQDGQALSSGKWRVTFTPGQPRPPIVINLEPKRAGDGPKWTITLPVGEVIAMRSSSGEGSSGTRGSLLAGPGSQSRSIDLDDSGKGDSAW